MKTTITSLIAILFMLALVATVRAESKCPTKDDAITAYPTRDYDGKSTVLYCIPEEKFPDPSVCVWQDHERAGCVVKDCNVKCPSNAAYEEFKKERNPNTFKSVSIVELK
jgi:hypothetical protein